MSSYNNVTASNLYISQHTVNHRNKNVDLSSCEVVVGW